MDSVFLGLDHRWTKGTFVFLKKLNSVLQVREYLCACVCVEVYYFSFKYNLAKHQEVSPGALFLILVTIKSFVAERCPECHHAHIFVRRDILPALFRAFFENVGICLFFCL